MFHRSYFRKILLAVLLIACLGVAVCSVSADAEDNFRSLVDQLYRDGVVSSKNGEYHFYNDYEDAWAQIGWYQWVEFQNASRFVFSSYVSWSSASQTPNNFESGCGLMFNIGSGNTNHLMASVRMDGNVYFSGFRGGQYLSYGKYYYGRASTKGSAQLTVVVNNGSAVVYIDGKRIVTKADLPIMGNGVGLVTMSGTNAGYGTRCVWETPCFYSW